MSRRINNTSNRYWILTINTDTWPSRPTTLPTGIAWMKGQKEIGGETGFEHWQVVLGTTKKIRLTGLLKLMKPTTQLQSFTAHCEPTRSEAAEDYCWKEETRVEGTQFSLGEKPLQRNSTKDWEKIWEAAKSRDIMAIPADIRIRCYSTLTRIAKDHMVAEANLKQVYVFWGTTGTGKSRRAWHEAGLDAYPKDPNTKFWDGYQGQEHVVMDEFRGRIDISHMLRWLDRYPVCVENKGSGIVFKARKIWITSNLSPSEWYTDLDVETKNALFRRFTEIVHFREPWEVPQYPPANNVV